MHVCIHFTSCKVCCVMLLYIYAYNRYFDSDVIKSRKWPNNSFIQTGYKSAAYIINLPYRLNKKELFIVFKHNSFIKLNMFHLWFYRFSQDYWLKVACNMLIFLRVSTITLSTGCRTTPPLKLFASSLSYHGWRIWCDRSWDRTQGKVYIYKHYFSW